MGHVGAVAEPQRNTAALQPPTSKQQLQHLCYLTQQTKPGGHPNMVLPAHQGHTGFTAATPTPSPALTTFSMKARRDSRLFSHSFGSSEVGGYLQQDSSNVISKQLAHT